MRPGNVALASVDTLDTQRLLRILAARRPPRGALNLAGAGGQSEPETKTRDILAS